MMAMLGMLLVASAQPQVALTVLAAASLRASMNEITRQFTSENPKVRIDVSYAGSQELAAQIQLGAPADVFFSADSKQMETLVTTRHIAKNRFLPIARNELTILVSKRAAKKVGGLRALSAPGLLLCMAAAEVSVGRYTRQALDKAKITCGEDWHVKVMANVRSFEPNVSAVVARIDLGEADAGIVYRTDARVAKQSISRPIPKSWNVEATYFGSPLQGSSQPQLARRLVDWVRSRKGQGILERNGFIRIK